MLTVLRACNYLRRSVFFLTSVVDYFVGSSRTRHEFIQGASNQCVQHNTCRVINVLAGLRASS